MDRTGTYVLYGAAGLVLYLVITKLTAKPASANPSASLSGLTGGNISSIVSGIGKGITSIFGGGSTPSAGAPTVGPITATNLRNNPFVLSTGEQDSLGVFGPTYTNALPTDSNTLPGAPDYGPDFGF